MEAKEILIRFRADQYWGNKLLDVRNSVAQLRKTIAEECTVVRKRLVLENDVDIYPHRFIREEYWEFIYPRQDVTLQEEGHVLLDENIDYQLQQQTKKYIHNRELVRGHMAFHYEDADVWPQLSIIDLLGSSEFPEYLYDQIDSTWQELQAIMDAR